MIIKNASFLNNVYSNGGLNPSFIGYKFDLTFLGRVVGASTTKVVTAVGENRVVAAKHYELKVGDRLQFVNLLNNTVVVSVKRIITAYGDVQVAEVDADLDTLGVSHVEVAELSTSVITQFLNKLGLFRKPALSIGVNLKTGEVVGAATSVHSVQRANPANIAQFRQTADVTIERGDSGYPDFVIDGGQLKLIGVRSAMNSSLWITSSVYGAV